LATSSDGKWLAVGGASGFPSKAYLELFDLHNTGNPPTPVEGFATDVSDLKFVDDNKLLIGLGNEGKTIQSYNFSTTTPIIESTAKIWQISVSPNGRWIAGALENGKVMLWDRQSGLAAVELFDNSSKYPLYSIAFSSDGKYLAAGDQRGWVYMFNMTNYPGGKLVPERTLSDHTAIVGNIRFSSDGLFMATASNDKFVKLWTLANLDKQPANLEFPDWVFSIAFSPDNSQIMAGTKDRVIKAFPTQIIAMSDKICGKITRNMTIDEWETYVGDDLPYEKTCNEYGDGEGAVSGKTPLEIRGNSR
jgi:WD40 repeat protein